MSLINDALKRATNFRKKENLSTPEGMPPLLVVNHDDSGNNRGKVVVLGAVLVAVLGYFAWNQFGGSKVEVVTKVQASKETPKSAKASGTNNNPIARAAKIAEGIRAANSEGAKTAEGLAAGPAAATEEKNTAAAIQVESKSLASEQPNTSPATISTPASQGDNASPASLASASINTADGDFPSVQLQAIYFRIRNPMAVVNGKTMRQGEEINGVKIAQIAHNEVRMEYQGALKTVTLR